MSALLMAQDADEAETALHRLPLGMQERLATLSPLNYLNDLHAQLIVLLHDRGDQVIPVGESRRLRSTLVGHARVHYTEMLFQHLDPVKGKLPLFRLIQQLGKFFRKAPLLPLSGETALILKDEVRFTPACDVRRMARAYTYLGNRRRSEDRHVVPRTVQHQARRKNLCMSPEEEKYTYEIRRTTMSYIMKPPSEEYSAPPAAGFTPPPQYSQPPRKSYRWVWMLLGTLALLCVLGAALLALGVGFAVKTYGGSTIASDQYYTAIRNQDYATAYSYLDSHLKTVFSQEAFTQIAQQRDAADGRVSHYAYTNVPIGDPATANLTVTRANGSTYTVHLEMRQEGGTWKVTAFDRI